MDQLCKKFEETVNKKNKGGGAREQSRRLPRATAAALELNRHLAGAGLDALEQHLAEQDFLLSDEFSLTDIIVGWTINWSRKSGLLETRPALQSYLARLFDRPQVAMTW